MSDINLYFSSVELMIMIDLMEHGMLQISRSRDVITDNDIFYDDIAAKIIAYCKNQLQSQDPV